MNRRCGPKCGQAGFSLVEMLVTLAVTGFLAVLLLAGMASASRLFGRTAAGPPDVGQIVDAHRRLRVVIAGLRPVMRLDGIEPSVNAQGDEAGFGFIAPPMDNAQPDALWRYRFQLTADGRLMLYHLPSLDQRPDIGDLGASGWQAVPLLENVATLRVSYYGADPAGVGGRRWQTRWNRRPQPPDLVRVTLHFRQGDRRQWPDLVVRPAATVNTACRIDALTGRCGADG